MQDKEPGETQRGSRLRIWILLGLITLAAGVLFVSGSVFGAATETDGFSARAAVCVPAPGSGYALPFIVAKMG